MLSSLNRVYLILFSLSWIALLLVVFFQEHGDFLLLINASRPQWLDTPMRLLTYLGDGIFFAVCVVLVMLYRWRIGVIYATAGVATLAISGFLKRVVFKGYDRPSRYFSEEQVLDVIEGVKLHGNHSFPSGHTMAIFTLCTLAALTIVRSRWLSVVLLFLAWIIGFTRIYILQHFLRDVVAGALLGVLIATISYLILRRWAKADQLSSV